MYYIMHRTQILLEEWQYEALKSRADRQGKSLSELIRDLVSGCLSSVSVRACDSVLLAEPVKPGRAANKKAGTRNADEPEPAWKKKLARIEGIGSGGGASGREHDRYLYDRP